MNLESQNLSDVRSSDIYDRFKRDIAKLNEESEVTVDGFFQDFRGFAAIICHPDPEELLTDVNPIERLMHWWINHKPSVTLLDLQATLMRLGRTDIYRSIAWTIDNHKNQTFASSSSVDSGVIPDDNIITNEDVVCLEANQSVMMYDAYMLYADEDDDDERFAFEIKEVLEKKYYFKICTKHDFALGVSFEHDAIMRMLDQKRCDKLIVILSKSFCHQFREVQDDLTRFIIKFAQSLQIHDNKKIIPCARDNYGIAYNLKGYSVLSIFRSGRLFNFWERLSSILDEGRVSVDERKTIQGIIEKHQFTIDNPNCPNEENLKSKFENMFSAAKKKIKKNLIKE